MTLLERAAFAAACAHHKVASVDSETATRFMLIAHAVIKAIREPSDAMDEAADDAGPDRAGSTYWRAMIDALLAEGV